MRRVCILLLTVTVLGLASRAVIAGPASALDVWALPAVHSGSSEAKHQSKIVGVQRWQAVLHVGGQTYRCIDVTQPNGRYRFGNGCPPPLAGETGQTTIYSDGTWTTRSDTGRVAHGTIKVINPNKFIAYSNGVGVVWTRVKTHAHPVSNRDISAMEQLGESAADRHDYAAALKWFKKAAALGDVAAQYNLGIMYDNGYGVSQNDNKALAWYRKAAAQGYALAQYNLGIMYFKGEGVKQNYSKALAWYRKAAAQGFAEGESNLGAMYHDGDGVTRDYGKALAWYRKAAAQGNADGENNLGVLYDNGEGVTQDSSKALAWFRKAAAQGNAEGEYNLGVMYYDGDGVQQNDNKALAWYRKAAAQGYAQARTALESLTKTGK